MSFLPDEREHLTAENDALRTQLAEAERERDLAIAHDRQPYPTAEAYELACAALNKWREHAETAESQLAESERLRESAEAKLKAEQDKHRVTMDLLEAVLRQVLSASGVEVFAGSVGPQFDPASGEAFIDINPPINHRHRAAWLVVRTNQDTE